MMLCGHMNGDLTWGIRECFLEKGDWEKGNMQKKQYGRIPMREEVQLIQRTEIRLE